MNDASMFKFPTKDALRFGWHTTLANLRPLLALGATGVVLAVLNHSLAGHGEGPRSLLALLVEVLLAVVAMQYIRVALRLYDGQPVDLTPRTEMLADFLSCLVTMILYTVIVVVGFLLLLVPGVIWSLKFGYAPFLVVDKDLDPIAALRESSRLTQGVKGQLLGFGLLMVCINLLGMIPLGLGLIVTLPTTICAAAYGLRQLQTHIGEPGSSPQQPGDIALPEATSRGATRV